MTDNEIVVVIRPSLKKVCNQDSCRAAILNHMLYWISRKKKDSGDYWYCKGEDIYHGLAETWGITIVRREVNALIDCGYIGETKNPNWGVDRTKHFFFEEEQAKVLFEAFDKSDKCPLCIGFPDSVQTLFWTHLINLSNANDSSVKCLCAEHEGHLINLITAFDRFINAFDKSDRTITKITTKITYKDVIVIQRNLQNKDSSFGETFDNVCAPGETLPVAMDSEKPIPQGEQNGHYHPAADTSSSSDLLRVSGDSNALSGTSPASVHGNGVRSGDEEETRGLNEENDILGRDRVADTGQAAMESHENDGVLLGGNLIEQGLGKDMVSWEPMAMGNDDVDPFADTVKREAIALSKQEESEDTRHVHTDTLGDPRLNGRGIAEPVCSGDEPANHAEQAEAVDAAQSTPATSPSNSSQQGGQSSHEDAASQGSASTVPTNPPGSPQEHGTPAEAVELIPQSTKPEMPPMSAKWPNKETAILVAQAIRDRLYTDKQLKDERKAAERMFKDYPDLTRDEFTTIFTDSLKWWREHDQGLFTIVTLMSKSKTTGRVHLERSLEVLEQRKAKSNGHSKPEHNGSNGNTNAFGLPRVNFTGQGKILREAQQAAAAAL